MKDFNKILKKYFQNENFMLYYMIVIIYCKIHITVTAFYG